MARRIYSEDLVLNLIINGKDMPAQNKVALNELYKLDRKTRELEISLAKVEVAQRKLGPRTAKNAAEFDKLAKSAQSLKIQIGQNTAAMNKLRQDIGRAGLTINQLNSYLKVLKIQLNNATDPRIMARLRKEIILTENRIKHMVTGASRLSIAFERLGTVANKFGTVTSWIAIVAYAFSRAVGGTVSTLRTLDKTFSNVMKTTGLTRQEMWALKQQFDQLNLEDSMKTPTATKDLLEIARIAGRLGVRGIQDISAFTMAVDKLYVALGEDLQGSVEEVAEKVGKLVTTFRLTDNLDLGEAMLRAGSLINELSKSSAAGAVTILNYTSRLGGVGSMAKFSMDQLAGMGAALDAVGVPAERGSTALAKLITGMGEHAEEFARSLGMSTEEYRNAMETNINDTMLKLIQSSAQGNASIMDVVAGMDQMDVSGVRVMEVYGKLVQNMDLVIQQQAIAKSAFSSSASVMNEFYIMSKDFDSLMAIQGKRWKSLADDYAKAVAPGVYKVYRGFTDLAYAMRDGVVWIGKHINLVYAMLAAWVAFKGVNISNAIIGAVVNLKVWIVELYRATAASIAHNATIKSMRIAYWMAGGGIAGFGAALKSLWVVVSKNPLGLLITAAGLVASAFFLFRKRAEELNSVLAKFRAEAQNEERVMGELFERVKENTEGTDARREAINRLNTVYGQYLPSLLTEKSSISEVEAAQRKANEALWESIALRVKETEISEINQRLYDKTKKNVSDILASSVRIKALEKTSGYNKGLVGSVRGQAEGELISLMQQLKENYDSSAIDKYIKAWGIGSKTGIGRTIPATEQIALLFNEFAQGQAEIAGATKELDSYISTIKKMTGRTEREGAAGIQVMSEADYEEQKKRIELQAKVRENELLQRQTSQKKGDEWLKKEELKSEEQKIRDLMKLEEEKWTKIITVDKDGVVEQQRVLMTGFDSTEEYVDLQNQLLKNLLEQGKPPGGGSRGRKEPSMVNVMKESIEDQKAELTQYYLWGRITKEQYDAALLELEEVHWAKQMFQYESQQERYKEAEAKFNAATTQQEKSKWKGVMGQFTEGSEKYLDAYQKWLDTQLKKQEAAKQVQEQIAKTVSWALNDDSWKGSKYEQEDQEAIDTGENITKNRSKIRRMLGFEQDEDVQAEAEIFEKQSHLTRLAQIEEWYRRGDIKNEQEYNLAKLNEQKRFNREKLQLTQAGLQSVSDIFSAMSGLYSAQMDAELEKAGENELAKEAIRRKYAKKQQKVQTGQAIISGALAIMGILEGTITKNPLIDSIIKAALIAGVIATTAINVATIRKQQFAKGNYPIDQLRQFAGGKFPVMGKDDGRTYDAEYVGPVKTGVYKKPSLGLFAERPEMVIDYPTLRNIQMNNPKLIEAILAHRVVNGSKQQPAGTDGGARQFAKGNYPVTTTGLVDNELKDLIMKNIAVNEKLLKWRPTVYSEMIKKDLETLGKIEKSRGMA